MEPGVVDEDVDAAVPLRDLAEHRGHGHLVGYVTGGGGRAAALGDDLGRSRRGGVPVDVGQYHVGAKGGQGRAEGLAEAAAAAGDHRDLAPVDLVAHRTSSYQYQAARSVAVTTKTDHPERLAAPPLLGHRLALAEPGDLVGRVPQLGQDLVSVAAPA